MTDSNPESTVIRLSRLRVHSRACIVSLVQHCVI